MSEHKVLEAVTAELRRLGVGEQIRARAVDGVVSLAGRVDGPEQRRLVLQTILQLPMVMSVRDELQPPAPEGDPPQQLRTILDGQGLAAAGLDIRFDAGVLTLAGQAADWFERDAAERLAWTIEGVRSVVNEAQIPAGAPDPEIAERSP
jgi:osmotically-inducible protein OsmY